jgi:hypothetical protein
VFNFIKVDLFYFLLLGYFCLFLLVCFVGFGCRFLFFCEFAIQFLFPTIFLSFHILKKFLLLLIKIKILKFKSKKINIGFVF